MGDDELEELRRRKLQELQQQQGQADAQQHEAQREEMENRKQMILRSILEPEARERLSRVRMARPEVAESVENQLIMLHQQGRLRDKVSDALLKQLLSRLTPKSREPNIERR